MIGSHFKNFKVIPKRSDYFTGKNYFTERKRSLH